MKRHLRKVMAKTENTQFYLKNTHPKGDFTFLMLIYILFFFPFSVKHWQSL